MSRGKLFVSALNGTGSMVTGAGAGNNSACLLSWPTRREELIPQAIAPVSHLAADTRDDEEDGRGPNAEITNGDTGRKALLRLLCRLNEDIAPFGRKGLVREVGFVEEGPSHRHSSTLSSSIATKGW